MMQGTVADFDEFYSKNYADIFCLKYKSVNYV